MTLTRQGFFCCLKQAINLTGMGRAVWGFLIGLLFLNTRVGLVRCGRGGWVRCPGGVVISRPLPNPRKAYGPRMDSPNAVVPWQTSLSLSGESPSWTPGAGSQYIEAHPAATPIVPSPAPRQRLCTMISGDHCSDWHRERFITVHAGWYCITPRAGW